jgi:type II protein arginine methyltransferase
MTFVTTPVTNKKFHQRVVQLVSDHLETLRKAGHSGTTTASAPLADPLVPPLTTDDTALFPSSSVNTYIAYTSPWIDLCSTDPIVASVSRQVLNLEVDYANFCGVRSIVVPGPRRDASKAGGDKGLIRYARAIQEVLSIGSRLNFLVHMPMYREPGLEEKVDTLSTLAEQPNGKAVEEQEIDLFSSWDSWHHIRSVCNYSMRLFVGKPPRP